jgi:hypothetical protein
MHRRFLDDRAWLENRRTMEILHDVESHVLALRDAPAVGACMSMDDTAAAIELAMERPLHAPAIKPRLDDGMPEADAAEIDAGAHATATFEGRRILKAFVDARWLAGFNERLAAYHAQLGAGAGSDAAERI